MVSPKYIAVAGMLYYLWWFDRAVTAAGDVSMSAQLVSLDSGPSIFVDKPILLVGRHPECDVLIDSRKVSRRHCCVAQVADYLVVRDLGSTNGIRINGIRALEGRLKPGDELTIGSYRYQVRWDTIPARLAPPKVAPREP